MFLVRLLFSCFSPASRRRPRNKLKPWSPEKIELEGGVGFRWRLGSSSLPLGPFWRPGTSSCQEQGIEVRTWSLGSVPKDTIVPGAEVLLHLRGHAGPPCRLGPSGTERGLKSGLGALSWVDGEKFGRIGEGPWSRGGVALMTIRLTWCEGSDEPRRERRLGAEGARKGPPRSSLRGVTVLR